MPLSIDADFPETSAANDIGSQRIVVTQGGDAGDYRLKITRETGLKRFVMALLGALDFFAFERSGTVLLADHWTETSGNQRKKRAKRYGSDFPGEH